MPATFIKKGDIVTTSRHKTKLLICGRNSCYPDQILAAEVKGDKPGRLRIITDNEITAKEADAGLQMLLMVE